MALLLSAADHLPSSSSSPSILYQLKPRQRPERSPRAMLGNTPSRRTQA
ncbi:hypothetical protein XBLMG947_1175 [Xanthomonas bromi]|uniref:Uncharacterized protein n=1 Tax=Xanthomonas bromi TaxID=56449 RepID=A0A1C3NJ60_9XANT|nr:hypothetical protein XBLMG947_1175 [Xanthomonas bromi]